MTGPSMLVGTSAASAPPRSWSSYAASSTAARSVFASDLLASVTRGLCHETRSLHDLFGADRTLLDVVRSPAGDAAPERAPQAVAATLDPQCFLRGTPYFVVSARRPPHVVGNELAVHDNTQGFHRSTLLLRAPLPGAFMRRSEPIAGSLHRS